MSAPKTDCLHYMRYAAQHFCKLPWAVNGMSDAKRIDLGCPETCEAYSPQEWKREAYARQDEEKRP